MTTSFLGALSFAVSTGTADAHHFDLRGAIRFARLRPGARCRTQTIFQTA
jgi:hypothetical protein